MENFRISSHTRFDIKYHFVWITKYRKPALRGQVARRLRKYIRLQQEGEPKDGGEQFQLEDG